MGQFLKTHGWPSQEYRIPEYSEFLIPGNFFEYEYAYLKEGAINPYIKEVKLPYYANHIKWLPYIHTGNVNRLPLQYKWLEDDIRRKIIRVKKIDIDHDEFDRMIYILNSTIPNHYDTLTNYLVHWVSSKDLQNPNFFNALEYIATLLNGWSLSKRLKFLTYIYQRWYGKLDEMKSELLKLDSDNPSKPFVFLSKRNNVGFLRNNGRLSLSYQYDINPMHLDSKNLEASPMKSNTLTQLDQQLLLLNKEQARQALKKANQSLTWKQVKEYVNNLWDNKPEKVLNYRRLRKHSVSNPHTEFWNAQQKKAYQISYAVNNEVNEQGRPSFEKTILCHGYSLNRSLLSKYHINPKAVTAVREVVNSTRKDPSFVEIVPHKKPAIHRKAKPRKRFVYKQIKASQLKFEARPEKLICLRHIEGLEVIRIPRKDIALYDDSLWSYCSKTAYKKYLRGSKKVDTPQVIKINPIQAINRSNNPKTGMFGKVKVPIKYRRNGQEYDGFTWKLKEEVAELLQAAKATVKEAFKAVKHKKSHVVKQAIRIPIVEDTIPYSEHETIPCPEAKPLKQDLKHLHKLKLLKHRGQAKRINEDFRRYKKKRRIKSPLKRRHNFKKDDSKQKSA